MNKAIPAIIAILLFAGCVSTNPAAVQNTVTKEIVELVRDASVEIVILKPEENPNILYEKELPWDNIPFHIRNDKYFSIGTAFAISPTELVSAFHVINLREKSSVFKQYFIRDSKGEVFEVDQVLDADNSRDFIHFTVKGKKFERFFNVRNDFIPNESVFTVGSALGEGIIIRSGLLLGTIPEDVAGRWNLLKSSAGANPGNSGGPLLDSEGNVIAIVQGLKDNIVYSLPMGEFAKAKKNTAVLSSPNMRFSLSNISQNIKADYNYELPLPLDYQTVKDKAYDDYFKFYVASMDKLLKTYKDTMFPNGKESKPLLNRAFSTYYPEIIFENKDDGSWNLSKTKTDTFKLDQEGSVTAGSIGGFATADIVKPKNVSLKDFYADPKVLMDYFLKAINISRSIGGEKIRITSFGKPFFSDAHVDSYKRNWMINAWQLNYADSVIIIYSTPTPQGVFCIFKTTNTSEMTEWLYDLKVLSNYFYFSYYGTFSDWKEFLGNKKYLPEYFSNVSLEYTEGEKVHFKTSRLEFAYTNDKFEISDDSILKLTYSFFEEGGKVKWDIRKVVVDKHKASGDYFVIFKEMKPGDDLPEAFQNSWKQVVEQKHPISGKPYTEEGFTCLGRIHSKYLDENVTKKDLNTLYVVYLGLEGKIDDEDIISKYEDIQKSVTILEK